jgi:hypothetical protein
MTIEYLYGRPLQPEELEMIRQQIGPASTVASPMWTRRSAPSSRAPQQVGVAIFTKVYFGRHCCGLELSVEKLGCERMEIDRAARTDHLDGMPSRRRAAWFICSAYSGGRSCDRRVAVLYCAGEVFACRRCYGLAYASQQERPELRSISRSWKIRERLGGSANLCDASPKSRRECTGLLTGAYASGHKLQSNARCSG